MNRKEMLEKEVEGLRKMLDELRKVKKAGNGIKKQTLQITNRLHRLQEELKEHV